MGLLPVKINRTSIRVKNPKTLRADTISCERIPIGEPDDDKPCVAKLPGGELLLTMFHQHKQVGGKILEQNLLFRSTDDGHTWRAPQVIPPPEATLLAVSCH